jgi:hypothetical protein
MSEPIRVSHYAAFLDAIRARVVQLGITHETLDAIAGLQSGYTSKILSPNKANLLPGSREHPSKRMGPFIMFMVVEALGLEMALHDDAEAMKRIQTRLQQRKVPRVRASSTHTYPFCFMPDFVQIRSQRGGHARAAKLSPKQRTESARKAANARWSRASTAAG